MKSTIRISNNGNTIRATGSAANELFKDLTEGISVAKKSACCNADVKKIPMGYICTKCTLTCEATSAEPANDELKNGGQKRAD